MAQGPSRKQITDARAAGLRARSPWWGLGLALAVLGAAVPTATVRLPAWLTAYLERVTRDATAVPDLVATPLHAAGLLALPAALWWLISSHGAHVRRRATPPTLTHLHGLGWRLSELSLGWLAGGVVITASLAWGVYHLGYFTLPWPHHDGWWNFARVVQRGLQLLAAVTLGVALLDTGLRIWWRATLLRRQPAEPTAHVLSRRLATPPEAEFSIVGAGAIIGINASAQGVPLVARPTPSQPRCDDVALVAALRHLAPGDPVPRAYWPALARHIAALRASLPSSPSHAFRAE